MSVRKKVCAIMMSLFIPVVLSGGATQALAACTTQGAFALALAQILGFEVATQVAAISALDEIGILPVAGWQPEVCITAEVVVDLDQSVASAVAAGQLTEAQAEGAIAIALATLGKEDLGRPLGGMAAIPFFEGSSIGGPPLEGSLVEGSEFVPR
jgi:hypothetical protein